MDDEQDLSGSLGSAEKHTVASFAERKRLREQDEEDSDAFVADGYLQLRDKQQKQQPMPKRQCTVLQSPAVGQTGPPRYKAGPYQQQQQRQQRSLPVESNDLSPAFAARAQAAARQLAVTQVQPKHSAQKPTSTRAAAGAAAAAGRRGARSSLGAVMAPAPAACSGASGELTVREMLASLGEAPTVKCAFKDLAAIAASHDVLARGQGMPLSDVLRREHVLVYLQALQKKQRQKEVQKERIRKLLLALGHLLQREEAQKLPRVQQLQEVVKAATEEQHAGGDFVAEDVAVAAAQRASNGSGSSSSLGSGSAGAAAGVDAAAAGHSRECTTSKFVPHQRSGTGPSAAAAGADTHKAPNTIGEMWEFLGGGLNVDEKRKALYRLAKIAGFSEETRDAQPLSALLDVTYVVKYVREVGAKGVTRSRHGTLLLKDTLGAVLNTYQQGLEPRESDSQQQQMRKQRLQQQLLPLLEVYNAAKAALSNRHDFVKAAEDAAKEVAAAAAAQPDKGSADSGGSSLSLGNTAAAAAAAAAAVGSRKGRSAAAVAQACARRAAAADDDDGGGAAAAAAGGGGGTAAAGRSASTAAFLPDLDAERQYHLQLAADGQEAYKRVLAIDPLQLSLYFTLEQWLQSRPSAVGRRLRFWVDLPWVQELLPRDLLRPGAVIPPDVGKAATAAVQQLLAHLQQAMDAAAAASDGVPSDEPAAADHQQRVLDAERYVRKRYGVLQLTLEERVQFRQFMLGLEALPHNALLVECYFTDYEGLEVLLQRAQADPGHVEAAKQRLLGMMDEAAVAASDKALVRDLTSNMRELRALFVQLRPNSDQQLKFDAAHSLFQLIQLPSRDAEVLQLRSKLECARLVQQCAPGADVVRKADVVHKNLLDLLAARLLGAAELQGGLEKYGRIVAAVDQLLQLLGRLEPTVGQIVQLMQIQGVLGQLDPDDATIEWFLGDVELMQLLEDFMRPLVTPQPDGAGVLQHLKGLLRSLLDRASTAAATSSSAAAAATEAAAAAAAPQAGLIKAACSIFLQLQKGQPLWQLRARFEATGFAWPVLLLGLSHLVQELLKLPEGDIRVKQFKMGAKWLGMLATRGHARAGAGAGRDHARAGQQTETTPWQEQQQAETTPGQEQQQAETTPGQEQQQAETTPGQEQQQAEPAISHEQQELLLQAAQAAFMALLTNCAGAQAAAAGTAVGTAAGKTAKLMDAEECLSSYCEKLPAAERLAFLQQSRRLMQLLYRVDRQGGSKEDPMVEELLLWLKRSKGGGVCAGVTPPCPIDTIMRMPPDPLPLSAEAAVAMVPAAAHHVEQLSRLLALSPQQQQQLGQALHAVQDLQEGDARVGRFVVDYECRLLDTLQDPRAHRSDVQRALDSLVEHALAQPVPAQHTAHIEALPWKERMLCDTLLLRAIAIKPAEGQPTLADKLAMRNGLDALAKLPAGDPRVVRFNNWFERIGDLAVYPLDGDVRLQADLFRGLLQELDKAVQPLENAG